VEEKGVAHDNHFITGTLRCVLEKLVIVFVAGLTAFPILNLELA